MRIIYGLAALTLMFVTASMPAQDKSMLTGKAWKVVKSEHAPPGTTMTFGADGKLMLTMPLEGKEMQMPGSYTLTGTNLILKFTNNGRDITDSRVIKKLSETTLITEDRNRKVEELQR